MNKKSAENKISFDSNFFAIFSYLSIFCIVPLILKKDNIFLLEHGRQGLVLFVAEVMCFILHIIFGAWFLSLGIFILGIYSLVGIINVVQGKYVKLYFVSDVAQKISL
ncbi:MAG: hypothetical protein KBD53_04575 [Candidatus Omnitrophica bacterium]|nr:hypothetical protein [Candidatus Omnitrophota bacterium]